jgi:hypothetical protein
MLISKGVREVIMMLENGVIEVLMMLEHGVREVFMIENGVREVFMITLSALVLQHPVVAVVERWLAEEVGSPQNNSLLVTLPL